jgi:NAD(P)-dependent dehydrogenase (short-subunit alcohol dehydrogenase family)
MNSETALITGASSGIGLHLAREFASHGHPLVLVAPVEEELQKISAEITDTYATKVRVLGTRAFQGQNLMAPQDVAKAGYEALMKGESLSCQVSRTRLWWQLGAYFRKLLKPS